MKWAMFSLFCKNVRPTCLGQNQSEGQKLKFIWTLRKILSGKFEIVFVLKFESEFENFCVAVLPSTVLQQVKVFGVY
jgi:hypothetical protein